MNMADVFSRFKGQPSAPSSPVSPRPVSMDVNRLHRATDEEIAAAWPAAIAQYGLQTNPDGTPVITADLLPKAEQKWVKAYRSTLGHDIHGERIYGHPGSGLSESGFGSKQVRSGSRGEEVFAKLLTWDGVLDRCVSFWSVWNIDDDGSKNDYGTDIDCVLKFGSHIFLVDVKNYRAGLDYHTLVPGHAMFCVYPVARVVANEPYVFSCNMGIAQEHMSEYLSDSGSDCTVESYVVLVPGQAGEATLDADICWPGGIPAMSYSSFVAMIQQRFSTDPSYASTEPTWEEGYLASLVKLYEHQTTLSPDEARDRTLWPRPTCDRAQGIEYPNPKRAGKAKSGTGKSAKGNAGASRRHDDTRGKSSSSSSAAATKARKPATKRGSTAADSPSSSRGKSTTRRKASNLSSIPTVDPATMSVTCGEDSDGNPVAVSFSGVSCMTIAGANRSGEVGRTFALAAALDQSDDVDLRIIDCKRTSQFSVFAERAYSYARLGDGLDLVGGAVQDAYTSLNSRLRKLRKAGISDYWSDPNHAGMPLDVMMLHGCEDLFDKFNADSESDIDETDAEQLADIRRYLRKIIDNGAKAGCCVVLSTQNPSVKAFPADLVESAQTRILYRIGVKGQSAAMLRGVDPALARKATAAALAIGETDFGTAVMITADGLRENIRFHALNAEAIKERYSFGG